MTDPSSSSPKRIVILGGAYGGISTAHYLLKHAIPKLPDPSSYEVILVSASAEAMCRPACPRALISDDQFNQTKLFVDIAAQFTQYTKKDKSAFHFIHGTATNLDHKARTVTVTIAATNNPETIPFHALVIATGSSTPSPLLSLNSSGQTTLHKHWETLRAALPTAKSIVISGGGPVGVETAGELGEHLNGRAGWFTSKLSNPKVPITLVTSGKDILPVLRPSIAQEGETMLAKVGVTVVKNTRVESVSPQGAGTADNVACKTNVHLSNGETLQADLYIPAFGVTPNTGFVAEELKAEDGRVETNPQTLRVEKAGERIYAIGDASTYAREAIHILTEAIPVLCANIKRDLLLAAGESGGEDRIFQADERETHLVPIGKSKGVGAAMGWKMPSFFVWLIKGRDYWVWTTGQLWSGKQWDKEK